MRFIIEKNTKPETFSNIINYIRTHIDEDGELDFADTFGNLDPSQRDELLDVIHNHKNPKGIIITGPTEAEVKLPLLTMELVENQTEINMRNEQLKNLTNNINTLESELAKLNEQLKTDPAYRKAFTLAKRKDAGIRISTLTTLPDGYETFSAYQQRAQAVIQDFKKSGSRGIGDELNKLHILATAKDIDDYAANTITYLRQPFLRYEKLAEGLKTAQALRTKLLNTIKKLEETHLYLSESIKNIAPPARPATPPASPAAPSAAAAPPKALDQKTMRFFAHGSGGASPKSPPSPGTPPSTPPSPGKNQIKADELEDLQMDEIINLVNHSGRDSNGGSLLLANIFQDNDKKQLFVDIFFKDESAGEKLKKLGDPIFKQVQPIILEANLTRLRL